jgi:hypothetical protein
MDVVHGPTRYAGLEAFGGNATGDESGRSRSTPDYENTPSNDDSQGFGVDRLSLLVRLGKTHSMPR